MMRAYLYLITSCSLFLIVHAPKTRRSVLCAFPWGLRANKGHALGDAPSDGLVLRLFCTKKVGLKGSIAMSGFSSPEQAY